MLPEASAFGPKILVADDDDLLSEVVSFSLQNHGYRVARAPDGIVSAELAHDADLVLLDAHIPGVDFAATLRLLHERKVPVLVLTGDLVPPPGVEAREYLAKPVALDDLLETVARLVLPVSGA